MDKKEFEKIVAEELHRLPKRFKKNLKNVEIIIQDYPDKNEIERMKIDRNANLLGLYEGIPLSRRDSFYGNVLPDVIVIYQRPIESISKDIMELRMKIRDVLFHEIAHHLGFDEEELDEMT